MSSLYPLLCRLCARLEPEKGKIICRGCLSNLDEAIKAHQKRFMGSEDRREDIYHDRLTAALRLSALAGERIRKAEEDAIAREAMETQEAHLRENASRALARRSLLHYVERKVANYQTGWVHEDIARRLERFMQGVERKESPRLMLFVPPRHGKSELASESGPAWMLGHHPEWTFILTSYSEDLPVKYSRRVREIIGTPEFKTLFANGPVVSAIDASARAWSTEQGGEVRASGVGGGILGMGAHVFIVDDPVKDQAVADSPTELEKIHDWLSSTAFSRLAPGGGVIIIQQRWSDEDPSGRLERRMEEELQEIVDLRREAESLMNNRDKESLEEARRYREEADELDESVDRWDIISYPALAVADEFLTPDGDIVRMTADAKHLPGTWRRLRSTGEALHPDRYSRLQLLKLKRANPRRFAAMYQQTPIIDSGEYFERAMFVRGKTPPRKSDMKIACAWDLAIGVKQRNDFTVGVAGGQDPDGNLWFLDRAKGKWNDYEKVANMMIDMHLRNHSSITGVERTHLEMALAPILDRRMRERKEYIVMAEGKEALKPISDKFVRARPLQALGRARKVFIPNGEEWDDFIGWLVRFGSTLHDDDVDAAAWLAQILMRSPPPRGSRYQSERKVPGSWVDTLAEEAGIHVGPGLDDSQGPFMGC